MAGADMRDDDLRLEHLDPSFARRVRQTVSCRDSDALPKVPLAGQVVERDGVEAQVMHNGVLVEKGGYFGDWMAEIIRALKGHHEPQEELVFHSMVSRVARSVSDEHAAPTMIEVGAYWAYYSLWFCHEIPTARAFGIEPDPAFLDVGRRNVRLNGMEERIRLDAGAIGPAPGAMTQFVAESDGVTRSVVQHDLESLMDTYSLDRVELVLADIQGWELLFLERAMPLLRSGRVRFLLVSTHHRSISGDPLTHQRVRNLLVEAGATVIAEHSVAESASGDGLVAVSFDERDADLVVAVSHARSRDTLFGELEYDVAAAESEAASVREQLAKVERQLARKREALVTSRAKVKRLRRRVRRLGRDRAPAVPPTNHAALAARRVRAVWRHAVGGRR